MKTQANIRLLPYMLVKVALAERAYIAEIISMPLPSGRIMVRNVPGHPGTLEELDVALLKPLPNQTKRRWVHYARVEGVGSFPVDMLRREHAAPVTFNLETGICTESELLVAKVTERAKRYKISHWRLLRLHGAVCRDPSRGGQHNK